MTLNLNEMQNNISNNDSGMDDVNEPDADKSTAQNLIRARIGVHESAIEQEKPQPRIGGEATAKQKVTQALRDWDNTYKNTNAETKLYKQTNVLSPDPSSLEANVVVAGTASAEVITQDIPTIVNYLTKGVIGAPETLTDLPKLGIYGLSEGIAGTLNFAQRKLFDEQNYEFKSTYRSWGPEGWLDVSMPAMTKYGQEAEDGLAKVLEPYNEWMVESVLGAYVPPKNRTMANKIVEMSVKVGMPIVPYLAGAKLMLASKNAGKWANNAIRGTMTKEADKEYKGILAALAKAEENIKKGIPPSGWAAEAKKSGVRTLDSIKGLTFHMLDGVNRSVGAGIGWAVSEQHLRSFGDTPEEKNQFAMAAPIFSILGALVGTAAPISYGVKQGYTLLGVTLHSLAQGAKKGRNIFSRDKSAIQNEANMLKGFEAMSLGVNFKDVGNIMTGIYTPEKVNDIIASKLVNKKAAASLFKMIHSDSFDPSMRENIQEALGSFKNMMINLSEKGKDVGALAYTMAQITGLSVLQAMQRTAMNSYRTGFFDKLDKNNIVSDLEFHQGKINKQIKFIRKELEERIEKLSSKVDGEEQLESVQFAQKNLEEATNEAEQVTRMLKESVDQRTTFITYNNRIELQQMATDPLEDGGFGARIFDPPKGVTSTEANRQITENLERHRENIDTLRKTAMDVNYATKNKLYDLTKPYMNNTVDATEIVRNVSNQTDEYAGTLLRFTTAGGQVVSRDRFLTVARKHALEEKESGELISILRDIHTNKNNYLYKNKPIEMEKLLNNYKKLNFEDNKEGARKILIDYISQIRGAGDDALMHTDNLTQLTGAKMSLKEIVEMRSDLAKSISARGYNDVASGQKRQIVNALTDRLNTVDDLKDLPEDFIDKNKSANDFYREIFGLGVRTSLGKKMLSAGRVDETGSSAKSLENFMEYILEGNIIDNVAIFKRIYPNTPHSITGSNKKTIFDMAAKQFQITLGRALAGKDSSLLFNKLDKESVAVLETNGMITAKQAIRLEKSINSRDVIYASIRSDNAKKAEKVVLSDVIPELQKMAKEGNSLFAKTLQGINNPQQLVKAIFENTSTTNVAVGMSRETAKIKAKELDPILRAEKDKPYPVDLRTLDDGTIVTSKTPIAESLEKTLELVPEMGRDSFLNKLLNNLGDKATDEVLDSIEALIVQNIYENSFKIIPVRTTGVGKISKLKDAFSKYNLAARAGLNTDIDLAAYSNLLTESLPALKEIAKRKGVKSSETFDKLNQMFQLSAMTIGKISDLKLENITKEMGVSAFLARAFAIQRGVVSFRFVATDAAIRLYHKKQIEMFQKMISDPKAVDIMYNTMLRDARPSAKDAKYLRGLFVGIFGQTLIEFDEAQIADMVYKTFNSDSFTNMKPYALWNQKRQDEATNLAQARKESDQIMKTYRGQQPRDPRSLVTMNPADVY